MDSALARLSLRFCDFLHLSNKVTGLYFSGVYSPERFRDYTNANLNRIDAADLIKNFNKINDPGFEWVEG
jgi:hypothetical protein